MPKLEIQLPDRIENEVTRLVDHDEFINRDQAIEELLALGVSAYDTAEPAEEDPHGEWDMQATEDQHDPALQDNPGGDKRTF